MARADTASASAHPDSIKGLAQSIAKPAYRRLLNAEPLLRRFDAEQGNESGLAAARVLGDGLAERLGFALRIEEIVR